MAIVIQLIAADEALLSELAQAIAPAGLTVSDPAPIEDAASLNLDLATVDVATVWDTMVAVGQLASALQVVQAVVDLLGRHRKQAAVTTTVEVVANGTTFTFSGDLSPEEAAERVRRFRDSVASALPAT